MVKHDKVRQDDRQILSNTKDALNIKKSIQHSCNLCDRLYLLLFNEKSQWNIQGILKLKHLNKLKQMTSEMTPERFTLPALESGLWWFKAIELVSSHSLSNLRLKVGNVLIMAPETQFRKPSTKRSEGRLYGNQQTTRARWSKHVEGEVGQPSRKRQENCHQFRSTPITHTISSNKHERGQLYASLAPATVHRPPLRMHQTHKKRQSLYWHLFIKPWTKFCNHR